MQITVNNSQFMLIKPEDCITAANSHLFEREFAAVLKQNPHSTLLVDLEQVEFLDSSGLMALISSWKLAQNLGKRLSLCSISPSLKIIIELTKLDRVFEIFDCQDTYIKTLS